MKFSESWLREWVNPSLNREALCDMLTMAGLEVEAAEQAASSFSGVVVGEIKTIAKHPGAEQLQVCQVDVGSSKLLNIVCGAPNAKKGMKAPVAMMGAVLPDNKEIKATTIRGVASEGMLCSAKELGLSENAEGLFELPNDAPPGQDLRSYLQLEDYVIDLSITPNRGDCLNVRGIAREVSALTSTPLANTVSKPAHPELVEGPEDFPITLQATTACPRYVGCIIRDIKSDGVTPVWLRERLRRSGIRSINPVVDATNYVMLELGQPMHAFDLDTLKKGIMIRLSKKGEKIALLDGSEKTLDDETLLIADHERPLAIAGVMGGVDSSVTAATKNIFLESAYFSPKVIARQRQYYDLNSDSAYRFERGVDVRSQVEAMERAIALISEMVGGKVGSLIVEESKKDLPGETVVTLTQAEIGKVLGIDLGVSVIEDIFKRLHFTFKASGKNAWTVTIPSYRTDITIPEDLIEEIARLHGYDKIPTRPLLGALGRDLAIADAPNWQRLRQVLRDAGYHEIISYSFVDKSRQTLFDPEATAKALLNPITSEMAVMRTNLWPGLINALLYNKNRQQHRVRLFEIGICFETQSGKVVERLKLGGLVTGLAEQEQWGIAAREADFYDVKGDIENMLMLHYPATAVTFQADSHPTLHPGQTASILIAGQKVGILGAVHPTLLKELDLPKDQVGKVFLFEVDLKLLEKSALTAFQEVSKFPEIRRDLAILVNEAITVNKIQDTIRSNAGDWLKDVFIFDVYQGKGISPGLKSVALALILQHPTRTLVDDEVTKLVDSVMAALKGNLGAELRS